MIKNSKKMGLFIIILAVFITACCPAINDSRTIVGNGAITSQETFHRIFDNIVFDGVGNVNIHFSDEVKVEVHTDRNIHQAVILNVNDNTLHIGQERDVNINFTRLEYDVYLPELRSLNLRGAGSINIDSGNAASLTINLSGVGNVNTANYEVDNVYIILSGAGNARISANNSLNGTLSGTGDIMFRGRPVMNVRVTGLGNIRPI
ncbi:MAG: DUF2807 domain-containing protein [Candidatus Cloacimonetes bacterium]|nr:DUF2807 domain-containing protein [Candidatus Cloacimonadota bacterium]